NPKCKIGYSKKRSEAGLDTAVSRDQHRVKENRCHHHQSEGRKKTFHSAHKERVQTETSRVDLNNNRSSDNISGYSEEHVDTKIAIWKRISVKMEYNNADYCQSSQAIYFFYMTTIHF